MLPVHADLLKFVISVKLIRLHIFSTAGGFENPSKKGWGGGWLFALGKPTYAADRSYLTRMKGHVADVNTEKSTRNDCSNYAWIRYFRQYATIIRTKDESRVLV